MDSTGKVNGAYQELLRRQGKVPPTTSASFSIRMNVNSTYDIAGVRNEREILTHLYTLIDKIKVNMRSQANG